LKYKVPKKSLPTHHPIAAQISEHLTRRQD
jgi:hypothetical protein